MLTEQISNGDTPRDAWMSWPEIDYSLVADGLLFRAHLYRCRYLGTTRMKRPRWLKENAGNFWRLEDLKEAPARLERPIESQNARVAPALPIVEPPLSDIRNGSDDPAVPVADLLPDDCSSPYQPTLPPTPAKPSASSESTQAELKPRGEAVVSEVKQPETGTDPVGAMGCNQDYSDARCSKKQKAPAERPKADRGLSPERFKRMQIVLENLRECPIYCYAAHKAGVHRKTVEYWLKCSRKGDDGYDIEWEGFTWRFHEHCTTAIDEAHDRVLASAWQVAMGVRWTTDENGNFVEEVVGPPNPKMIRFLLEWKLPEKWGKYRKIDRPQTGGVLVIGEVTNEPKNDSTASIKARQWKRCSKMIREAGA
jgi:hypothetical protein